MKKIMFNELYGLNQAVLDLIKTNTRRIITCPKSFKGQEVGGFYTYRRMWDNAVLEYPIMHDADGFDIEGAYILPKYKVGEVVAIAQSYKDCGFDPNTPRIWTDKGVFIFEDCPISQLAGWSNKLFVLAALMPHHIRVTNVRVERLQDISDEDCFREGIRDYSTPNEKRFGFSDFKREVIVAFKTPREAYAALIDKISGKGTWKSNPYVFVYDFELVK